jgi:hypothetical protein
MQAIRDAVIPTRHTKTGPARDVSVSFTLLG